MAYLSIVAGAGMLLKKKYNGKTLHTLADRLCSNVNMALDLWNVVFDLSKAEDAKTFNAIKNKTTKFDELTFGKEISDPKVLTSTLLGLSNQMERFVTTGQKSALLSMISDDLNRLHRYFDSRGRAWDSYTKAEEAITIWNIIFNEEGGWKDVQVPSMWVRKTAPSPHLHTCRKKKSLAN